MRLIKLEYDSLTYHDRKLSITFVCWSHVVVQTWSWLARQKFDTKCLLVALSCTSCSPLVNQDRLRNGTFLWNWLVLMFIFIQRTFVGPRLILHKNILWATESQRIFLDFCLVNCVQSQHLFCLDHLQKWWHISQIKVLLFFVLFILLIHSIEHCLLEGIKLVCFRTQIKH